ncbi:MAG: class I SAM-dependent methyltransferase, partial [Spirochaetia bacterium]
VGRHAVELNDLGFSVTGVDRLQSYLDAARETASEAYGDSAGEIEFVLEDVRRFVRPEYFDGAINMFTSLGYFDELDDELLFLKNVQESLKPGGSFLIDVMGKEILAKFFKPSEWYEADCGLVLAEYTILDGWTHLHNRWIVINDEGRYEYSFAHRVFSGVELTDLLIQAGFDTAEVYGSLDRIPYDNNAERLVAVGRKETH